MLALETSLVVHRYIRTFYLKILKENWNINFFKTDFATFGAQKLLISSDTSSSRVTIELLIPPNATVGDNPVTGFKIELRKLNSNNWGTLEYSDTQPKDITDVLEEGFTYEFITSLKNGDSYGEPEASQTLEVPCRGNLLTKYIPLLNLISNPIACNNVNSMRRGYMNAPYTFFQLQIIYPNNETMHDF